MSRHKIGDKVRVWKPRRVEHGCVGIVSEIIPIEKYHEGQPEMYYRGPHAYKCAEGFIFEHREGYGAIRGFLPDAMVVSEEEFHKSEYNEPGG
jgi:hypothetical protein